MTATLTVLCLLTLSMLLSARVQRSWMDGERRRGKR